MCCIFFHSRTFTGRLIANLSWVLVAVPTGASVSAVPAQVVPETPGSPIIDVVPSTPAPARPAPVANDPVLTQILAKNAEGFRKRRLALQLSPDFEVAEPPPKHHLKSVKANISRFFAQLVANHCRLFAFLSLILRLLR